jgi:hypothetical protein
MALGGQTRANFVDMSQNGRASARRELVIVRAIWRRDGPFGTSECLASRPAPASLSRIKSGLSQLGYVKAQGAADRASPHLK